MKLDQNFKFHKIYSLHLYFTALAQAITKDLIDGIRDEWDDQRIIHLDMTFYHSIFRHPLLRKGRLSLYIKIYVCFLCTVI